MAGLTKRQMILLVLGVVVVVGLAWYFILGSPQERGVLRTIEGEYLPVGNPPTIEPPLPGVVYAVFADDECYYLTMEGSWIWENRAWDGYMPKEGDRVKVTGYVSKRLDVNGDPFYEIEVVSLKLA